MNFFRKKETTVPTVVARLLFFLLTIVLLALLGSGLYPFLAQNRPFEGARLAVIEGWIPDAALVGVLDRLPDDTLYVTTGGPITFGADFFDERTYAELTTSRLLKLGVDPESILTAPAPDSSRDRTFVSALAVRRVLESKNLFGGPVNIYTLGPHSRRSFLLYRFAFGPDVPLGTVALESRKYDLRHWWRTSPAFKKILSEMVSLAYTYCTYWKYD